jgi:GNAT superfamily N-acetyltransferase
MSLTADELAEMARNRGLKLVRSRIRSPQKRLYGKLALSDAKGGPLFGFDDKGRASAAPEAVEDYLRNLDAGDWGASLDVPVAPRKRKKPKREAANDAEPEPPPPPKPQIREAKPADAPHLVELMSLLGHEVDAEGVRKRVTALARAGMPQLVATLDKDVIGLVGIHSMVAIHREQPVGRITILAVADGARKQGIGRMLVEAAEERLRKLGCKMIEVTSNDRLKAAHRFYQHLGYKRTSVRLFKSL